MKEKQARGWVLTINNPTQTNQELADQIINTKGVEYCVFQREQGEMGTPHIQLYIEYKSPKKFDQIKKQFPTAHIEQRKGSKEQAQEYCSKSDTRVEEPIEIGTFKPTGEGQGKRTDLDDVADAIMAGAKAEDIRSAYPTQYLKMQNHINSMIDGLRFEYHSKHDRPKLNVTYIGGLSRTGKSYYVRDKYRNAEGTYAEDLFVVNDYEHPFDNYRGQRAILFEEFRSSIKVNKLLSLLENYVNELSCRYNNKYACWTEVYIVSNWDLQEQYRQLNNARPEDLVAFHNRIDTALWVEEIGDIQNILADPQIVAEMTKEIKAQCHAPKKYRYDDEGRAVNVYETDYSYHLRKPLRITDVTPTLQKNNVKIPNSSTFPY